MGEDGRRNREKELETYSSTSRLEKVGEEVEEEGGEEDGGGGRR